ncbi:MAG: sulfatase-like hydrolase/transferase [Candidatus Poribacteria bacterium]|nr:sulfatase-like hydrolase/transferase [Candidatus Poribacteria bacterium]
MKETKQQRAFSRPFNRRDFLSTSLKASAAAFMTGLFPNRHVKAEGKYNVLFIIVDDLRPMLGCYGHPEMHTPNIDRIAEQGTVFNRAYCQYPLCSPSRTSLITGLRPETTNVRNNSADFRQKLPNVVTLPQHFKSHGYYTQSVGRIAHLPRFQDDENSWSTSSWRPVWIPFDIQTTPSWQALDVKDDDLRDGKTARRAVQVLKHIKDRQFFLAVGFYKPHLPLEAPRKYFDLYDTQIFNLPASSMPPENAPSSALTDWSTIRDYQDLPSGTTPLSDAKTLELIRAYAAATSYIDAQIGRILAQLDILGLTENTVIVFCGDHGHHLGEHGIWGKKTLFEVSLRSPLIVSVPQQQSSETEALAELVDIYPTLCDACQLPIPLQSEGTSLMPILEQPTLPWKNAAFSQFGGAASGGISIRTERYRYTEWGENGSRGVELYDYDADPNETVNIVDFPENAKLVAHLSERLRAGWRGALPDVQQQISTPQTLPWDINSDGVIDIRDLVLVSNSFGVEVPAYPKADVNKDGKVDITDLLLVAAHFGESGTSNAPSMPAGISSEHFDLIEQWLTEAHLAHDGTPLFQRGIATLERLIDTVVPAETVLLPNYPNPFNPETWISYDLAEDVDVHIHIYTLKGESVRQLSLGFQTAGTYRTRSRAAYWDGRDSVGERVASGVYFYTLHAGKIKATRQMVILK